MFKSGMYRRPRPRAPNIKPAGCAVRATSCGTVRMLLRHDLVALAKSRSTAIAAPVMAIDARGQIVIVEVKGVPLADLLGDIWTIWITAIVLLGGGPARVDATRSTGRPFCRNIAGIIVADRYDAAIVREAHECALSAATRKRATFGRRRSAADRVDRPGGRVGLGWRLQLGPGERRGVPLSVASIVI